MNDVDHLTQNAKEICQVCSDEADGYHYGVLSCRGCNAFFRRSITYNLSFQCRRSGNCVIDKNKRCACRSCRLAKCKMVGMDRTAVQPRRDGKPTSLTINAPTTSNMSDTGSIGESCKSSPQSVISSPSASAASLGANAANCPSNSQAKPSCALTRMVEDYCDQRRRRRAMLCSTLEEILSEEGETRLKGPAAPEDFSAIYRVQMILMFEWAEKLEQFKLIVNPHDKAKLLRAFSMKYLLLDNIYHTIELNYTDRLVLVNNSYIQPGRFPSLHSGDASNAHEALALMYGETCSSILEELVRPMIEMNVTFGEILAVRSIIFWNPGSVGLNPQTIEIIHKASEQAIKELHNWFDENNVREVKTRLGNLLLLLSPLAKHTQNAQHLIPNFGVFPEWDSFMNDLLTER